MPSGLKALVFIHLAIGTLPAASLLIPASIRYLPLMWALSSVRIGQLLVLSFWVGMSPTKGVTRIVGALCGAAYLAAWLLIAHVLSPDSEGTPPFGRYCAELLANGLIVFLFAGVFWLVRRWGNELRRVPDSGDSFTPGRFQYSILHILIMMSLVAVVLGLVRNARTAEATTGWQVAFAGVLMFIVMLLNAICAAFAALGSGRIRLRIVLVLIVASLLGIALSLAFRHDRVAWWLVPSATVVTVVPTAIVVGSLLAVRSCGYRLVPKTIAHT